MPDGGSHDPNVVMIIEEQIRTAFETRGWRVFVPEQFSAFAAEEKILGALIRLADDGKLSGEAVYRCPDGHDYGRRMTLTEVDPAHAPPCPVCALPEMDEDPRVVLRFSITDEWAGLISESKKKADSGLMGW